MLRKRAKDVKFCDCGFPQSYPKPHQHSLPDAPPAHSPMTATEIVALMNNDKRGMEYARRYELFPELVETLEAFHMYCKVCKTGMAEHCVAKDLLRRAGEGR